jgi:hypothetical protein
LPLLSVTGAMPKQHAIFAPQFEPRPLEGEKESRGPTG